MKFTENLHLTQYDFNDDFSVLGRYNEDMRNIDVATSSTASGVLKLVEDLQNQSQENKEIHRQLTADLHAVEDRMSNVEVEMDATKLESAATKELAERFENRISKNESDIAALTAGTVGAVADVITEVKELKTDTAVQREADRQRISVLETSATQQERDIEALQANASTSTADVIELQSKVATAEEVLNETVDRVNMHDRDVAQMSSAIGSNQSSIGKLGTRMTAVEQKADNAEQSAADNAAEIAEVKKSVAAYNKVLNYNINSDNRTITITPEIAMNVGQINIFIANLNEGSYPVIKFVNTANIEKAIVIPKLYIRHDGSGSSRIAINVSSYCDVNIPFIYIDTNKAITMESIGQGIVNNSHVMGGYVKTSDNVSWNLGSQFSITNLETV